MHATSSCSNLQYIYRLEYGGVLVYFLDIIIYTILSLDHK